MHKVEITHKTIIFTVMFLLFLWFLYSVKDIIFLLFVSFIFMSALKPLVEFTEKWKVPRVASIILIYILLIVITVFAGSSFVPPLIVQSVKLAENLPRYISVISPYVTIDYNTIASQFGNFGQNLFRVTVSVFSDIIGFFTVMVVTLYMLLERKNLEKYLETIMGSKNSKEVINIFHLVENRLGAWVRGQLALGITIGIMTAIILWILNLPYILPLSIIAGLLELVPNIGPIVSSIPAILIAFTISPLVAGITALAYFLIQQLENHVIVPQVMRRVVGLPPLITIIALMVGGKLAGIPGVLLAVPLVVTAETLMGEYYRIRTGRENSNKKVPAAGKPDSV